MELRCFLVVPPGAEHWAERELLEYGGPDLQVSHFPGGLEFNSDFGQLRYWHSHLRIPVRMLVRLYEVEVTTWEDLWRALDSISWGDYFSEPTLPKIHVSSRSSKLFHKQQLTERTEKWFKKRGATQKGGDVYLRLFRDQLTVSLDATGEPLFKRGAKQDVGKAPLRENLAHLMLKLVTQGMPPELFSKYQLVDPMAGSGTLLLEALGGSLEKRSYAFEHWPIFEGSTDVFTQKAWGFGHHVAVDRDQGQFERLKENLAPFKSAGHSVEWFCQDSLEEAPALPRDLLGRILVANPPFGGRLKRDARPEESLRKLLKVYQPWRVCFIGPAQWKLDGAFPGYRTLEKVMLSHGGLDVQMIAITNDEPLSMGPIAAEIAAD